MLLCRTPAVAKEISQDVLEQVLQSTEFVVMQVEVDVYNFLKIWVYLKLHPTCDLPLKAIVQETQKFFVDRETEFDRKRVAFLATEDGLQFASTFKCLKLERLLEDSKAINLLKKDSIIPRGIDLQIVWENLTSGHENPIDHATGQSQETFIS